MKNIILIITLAMLSLSGTACSNKSSKSSNIGSGAYIYSPGCPGCAPGVGGVGTNIVAAALAYRQDSMQSIEMGLNVFGAGGFPAYAYYGPVTASGYVLVNSGMWNGCSVLPPGMYSIRSLAANGSFAPDTSFQAFNLMNFQFDAVHSSGFVARFQLNYAEFFDQMIAMGADGRQYPHGMYGEVRITQVTPAPSCYVGPVTLFFPRPLY